MWSWWDSIDAVSKFNAWTQYAIAVFGILTAVAIVASAVAGKRISVLQAAKEELLQQRLKAAEDAAEAARSGVKQFEQRQQPRFLTPAQDELFLEVLRKAPPGTVEFNYIAADPEAEAFAKHLLSLLRIAGWTIHVSALISPDIPVGIQLEVQSVETAPPYAAALQQALKAVGYDAPGTLAPARPKDWLSLIVGRKP